MRGEEAGGQLRGARRGQRKRENRARRLLQRLSGAHTHEDCTAVHAKQVFPRVAPADLSELEKPCLLQAGCASVSASDRVCWPVSTPSTCPTSLEPRANLARL